MVGGWGSGWFSSSVADPRTGPRRAQRAIRQAGATPERGAWRAAALAVHRRRRAVRRPLAMQSAGLKAVSEEWPERPKWEAWEDPKVVLRASLTSAAPPDSQALA